MKRLLRSFAVSRGFFRGRVDGPLLGKLQRDPCAVTDNWQISGITSNVSGASGPMQGAAHTAESDAAFGQVNGTLNPRQLQLALRVSF